MNALIQKIDLKTVAVLVLAAGLATIAGAWTFQALGYAPCELCYKQRWAYYAGLPLAALALSLSTSRPMLARALLWIVSALFLANVALAFYHSGVEWRWWPGPDECTGAAEAPKSFADFQSQLKTVRPVRCDEPAVYIFGLTMANWNVMVSAGLAFAAAFGARRRDKI